MKEPRRAGTENAPGGAPEDAEPLEDGTDGTSVAGPWIELPVTDVFGRLSRAGHVGEVALQDALRDLVVQREPATDPRHALRVAEEAIALAVRRGELHPPASTRVAWAR